MNKIRLIHGNPGSSSFTSRLLAPLLKEVPYCVKVVGQKSWRATESDIGQVKTSKNTASLCWAVPPPSAAPFHPADIAPLWEMAGLHRGYSIWPLLTATQRFYAHSCRNPTASAWTGRMEKKRGSTEMIVLAVVASFPAKCLILFFISVISPSIKQ